MAKLCQYDIRTMSKQEIFDAVASHLLVEQKERSLDENGFCRYSGDDGLSCALGILLVDYKPEYDCSGGVASTQGIFSPWFDDVPFLLQLQNCHDNQTTDNWKRELNNIAETYSLKRTEHPSL